MRRGQARPVLNYFGGKWLLAPWIIEHFPAHLVYVESFGGGANVLLRKARSKAEIYNDIDGEIVNVFRVLREPELAALLIESLRLTPFAREEFLLSHKPASDPVEQARRTIARSFMGHGASTATAGFKTTFRATSTRSDTHPARSWMALPAGIVAAAERLRGVAFENRPAAQVMRQYDGPDALHYLDPPYVLSTRSGKHRYKHEFAVEEHEALLELACELVGCVVISGYASKLYDDRLRAWRRVQRRATTQGGAERTEVLWINPLAAAKLDQPRQTNLFDQETPDAEGRQPRALDQQDEAQGEGPGGGDGRSGVRRGRGRRSADS